MKIGMPAKWIPVCSNSYAWLLVYVLSKWFPCEFHVTWISSSGDAQTLAIFFLVVCCTLLYDSQLTAVSNFPPLLHFPHLSFFCHLFSNQFFSHHSFIELNAFSLGMSVMWYICSSLSLPPVLHDSGDFVILLQFDLIKDCWSILPVFPIYDNYWQNRKYVWFRCFLAFFAILFLW